MGRRTTTARLVRAIQAIAGLPVPIFFASSFCAAAATTYDVQLDQSKFVHIDQANVPAGTGDNGSNSCVPTATMNSFQYLNTAYPQVYGTNPGTGRPNLMGNSTSWTGAAIDLAQSYMNTDPNSGTSDAHWIQGKVEYLGVYAPGKTIFEGMDSVDQGGQSWVQNANPTANFLYNQLKAGEDVEIGITPPGVGQIGHCMTLTSIHWVDTDSNNAFNAGDTLTIDGIDPAGGAAFNYTLLPGDPMKFSGGTYDNYVLDAALAESPDPSLVPEPQLLGLALLAGTVARRRRA